MTQEELDALMAGGLDDEDEQTDSNSETNDEDTKTEDIAEEDVKDEEYKLQADKAWPPPPPTEDHKVVEQLDDVTKDSEVKATEIFDKLEAISDFIMQVENDANDVSAIVQKNIEVFEKLTGKFPEIGIFQESLENNQRALKDIENLISNAQMSSDEIMMIMDIMQYQDIHRQKIERVINVIRTLAGYMNSLFSAEKDDSKRVSSAVHIAGDSSTEDVVSNDDIEALIESLGKK
ncbi:MAG: protein phosphatase CheZ [Epsilonproteobacteria bacterium]|nr:protein phosphatase CheZ [Campylobacterota bacterium]